MGACNQGKEGFEILISESSLVDTRSATGEGVYLLHLSFHSRFVSYPMKANSLRSTYGKRSMLYIIPSHLRIRSRTLTRVLGGFSSGLFTSSLWSFRDCVPSHRQRPRFVRHRQINIPHSVVSVGRSLLLTPHSVSFFWLYVPCD